MKEHILAKRDQVPTARKPTKYILENIYVADITHDENAEWLPLIQSDLKNTAPMSELLFEEHSIKQKLKKLQTLKVQEMTKSPTSGKGS